MSAHARPMILLATVLMFVTAVGCSSDGGSQPSMNKPPVADAGANQEADAGTTVLLDGSGSTDPDGDALLYHWRQVTGTVAVLSDSLAVQATFTAANTSENLTFQLSVTDGGGLGDTDQTIVAVNGAGTPPTANAGADQTVQVNRPAVLSGTGHDPDGGPVTFAWTQFAGTTVTLSDPAIARPEFMAPVTPTVLEFELAVTDTSGAITRDSTTVTIQTSPAPLVPTLFVVGAGDKLYGWTRPETRSGDAVPDVFIEGASTMLDGPNDVVVDAKGAALVSNPASAGGQILSWAAVNQLGDVAPNRVVEGDATGLRSPRTMAIGPSVDVLFVCDAELGTVGVWDRVSEPRFQGNVSPTRVFWPGPSVLEPAGASYDEANDLLYVANRSLSIRGLIVFRRASELTAHTGKWIANVHDSMGDISDVFYDHHNDRLYVTNGSSRSVLVFDDAETIAPQQAPDRTITIGDNPQAIVVDAQGRGYVADITNKIYRIDDIDTTQLQAPSALFLTE